MSASVTFYFRVLRVDAAAGGRKFSRIQTSLLSPSIVENTMRVPSGCTAGESIRALIEMPSFYALPPDAGTFQSAQSSRRNNRKRLSGDHPSEL